VGFAFTRLFLQVNRFKNGQRQSPENPEHHYGQYCERQAMAVTGTAGRPRGNMMLRPVSVLLFSGMDGLLLLGGEFQTVVPMEAGNSGCPLSRCAVHVNFPLFADGRIEKRYFSRILAAPMRFRI